LTSGSTLPPLCAQFAESAVLRFDPTLALPPEKES
jgi:hypothetical protein